VVSCSEFFVCCFVRGSVSSDVVCYKITITAVVC